MGERKETSEQFRRRNGLLVNCKRVPLQLGITSRQCCKLNGMEGMH